MFDRRGDRHTPDAVISREVTPSTTIVGHEMPAAAHVRAGMHAHALGPTRLNQPVQIDPPPAAAEPPEQSLAEPPDTAEGTVARIDPAPDRGDGVDRSGHAERGGADHGPADHGGHADRGGADHGGPAERGGADHDGPAEYGDRDDRDDAPPIAALIRRGRHRDARASSARDDGPAPR